MKRRRTFWIGSKSASLNGTFMSICRRTRSGTGFTLWATRRHSSGGSDIRKGELSPAIRNETSFSLGTFYQSTQGNEKLAALNEDPAGENDQDKRKKTPAFVEALVRRNQSGTATHGRVLGEAVPNKAAMAAFAKQRPCLLSERPQPRRFRASFPPV